MVHGRWGSWVTVPVVWGSRAWVLIVVVPVIIVVITDNVDGAVVVLWVTIIVALIVIMVFPVFTLLAKRLHSGQHGFAHRDA